MREVRVKVAPVEDVIGLDAALRAALPGHFLGLQTYTAEDGLGCWLSDEAATDADEQVIAAVTAFITAPTSAGRLPPINPLEAKIAVVEQRLDVLEQAVKKLLNA